MLTIMPIWLLTKHVGLFFFLNGLILLFTLLVDDRINRKKRVALELLFHIFFSPLPLKTTLQPVLPSVSSCGWRYSGTVCAQQSRCVPYLIRHDARESGAITAELAHAGRQWEQVCVDSSTCKHTRTHTRTARARARTQVQTRKNAHTHANAGGSNYVRGWR